MQHGKHTQSTYSRIDILSTTYTHTCVRAGHDIQRIYTYKIHVHCTTKN